MRVLLWSEHRYPAFEPRGCGRQASARPSNAPAFVHDLLAKGLAAIGHDVYYLLADGWERPLPPGVTYVDRVPDDADVFHNLPRQRGPWVQTVHRAFRPGESFPRNAIFVSRALAQAHDAERFVHNGIDPDDYIFRDRKRDYALFLSALQGPRLRKMYLDKGLDTALAVCAAAGIELVVAGTAMDDETLSEIDALCSEHGARYVGDVRGAEKAELLAGARALLFPTRLVEGFGLVMTEALMSGTPVLCSDKGACPEIVSADTGFICRDADEFHRALLRAGDIDPHRCRARAMQHFDYRVMAEAYVREYERECSD
jgi:glycosyltransferase involved in cell wall biosynthesis